MRSTPLTKEEKEEVRKLLTKLQIVPPTSGQVLFNIDGNGSVASAELARIIWR